jgi:hypothetical protein
MLKIQHCDGGYSKTNWEGVIFICKYRGRILKRITCYFQDATSARQSHEVTQELIALFHPTEGRFSLPGPESRDVCAVILKPLPSVWGEKV